MHHVVYQTLIENPSIHNSYLINLISALYNSKHPLGNNTDIHFNLTQIRR